MNKIYNSFLTSFGLICRIPIKMEYKTDFSLFGLFFPLIGIIVSALVLVSFYILNLLFSQLIITAVLIIFIQYSAFNLFHFDGLLDCADAFFFNTGKKRRLEILIDKRTGSFAVFAGTLYLILKVFLVSSAVNSLGSNESNWGWIVLLFIYPLSGRISGSLMPALISPADDPGLAKLLLGYSKIAVTIGIMLSYSIPFGIVYLLTTGNVSVLLAISPLIAAIISGLLISGLSKKMLGGYTGDSIGLSIEIGELVHLIVLVEIMGRLF